jgi:2-oxoisovalerate dehydrogenase E2 component (dihydrolipoyl transacylase)
LPVTIELPHVGESVVEGTIGKWLKQPGDTVRRYEPLVEVVTDKVTMEVPSPVAGSLVRLLAEEGETLPMGAPIAEVEVTGGAPAPAPTSSAPQPATPPPSPGAASYLMRDVTPVGPTGGAAVEAIEPVMDGGSAAPPPRQPVAVTTPPVTQPAPAPSPAATPDGGPRLSPVVRRLAREHSIDVSLIQGTGLGGRITRDDVLKHLEQGPPAAALAPASAPAAATPPPAPLPAGPDEERVPLTPVRRIIAEAMVRSVTEIPHAWSSVEVDVTGLVALRAQMRGDFERQEGVPLTYLPFAIKAVIEALKKVPTMNASWGGDAVILKRRINLGLAVAAPNGLIVPVIHDADQLSLSGVARALNDLTVRARNNRLTLDDVQGGTFTLNNTGALGSITSGPIINHPQAGIMTTDAILKRAVVRDDAIAIRSMMNLCLSFDHRINDGAEASAFLETVKARLESLTPDTPVF